MPSKISPPSHDKNRPPRGETGRPKIASLLWYVIIAVILISFIYAMGTPSPKERIAFSEFMDHVEKGDVQRVELHESRVVIELKPERVRAGDPQMLHTNYIAETQRDLANYLQQKGVKFSYEVGSGIGTFLAYWIVPLLFVALIFVFMTRQMGRTESVLSFGRSRARIVAEKDIKTTFNDVAGADEAKQELQEIADFLRNPAKYSSLGGKIPKGVLLVGPPGCGKTLIARAVAGEAGVPFFSLSGSDFVEMFVGVGAARVRDLFNQAKSKAPCIIFIDEIDAVGRQRGAGIGGGHDEREQTLNQLLVEMDGFETEKGTIILAATNRPDVLDPALLRPGRFDRRVVIDQPDQKGRHQILMVHTRSKPLAEDVDVEVLARRTPGFSGADLENVANEAALLAARYGRTRITMRDFEDAVERVVAGPERRSRIISEREKRILAYHELGHALTALRCKYADPVHKVSIIPRGHAALGYTLQLPLEDKYIISREELLDRITTLMGGRAAEEVVFGLKSSGAQNDIERASDIARQMVAKLGMGGSVGPVHYGQKDHEVFLGRDLSYQKNFSEETARVIDREVTDILMSCYERARRILEEGRKSLDQLAEKLVAEEVMEGEEIRRVVGEADPGTLEERGTAIEKETA
ncbi:MAG: ATP-dependent zinc metalloprotease FtsH [Planctomycetota bacterium]